MATLKQIQFKRSKTAGARPAASVLAEGELAINLKDRTLFTKDDSGNIIDLSISAGGSISGNITQTGDYLQNGTYNLNGNQFVYAGKYIEFLPKTAGNGAWANQHLNKAPIFTDLSSTTSVSEYHPLIKQRYKDGTFSAGTLVAEGSFKIHYINESGDSKYWTFNRNGNFQVDTGDLFVSKGNISASGNINSATGIVSAPQINTKTIVFDTKAFGQYDSQSLVQYVYPGTGEENGINYLRKVRAKSGGTIYHEIASAQTGKNDEISWWTGNSLTTKLMGLRNDGAMVLRRSLAIGTITADENTNNYGSPTPMGERYIALGDAATGLKYIKQGVYDLVGNWNSVASITPDSFRSTRKGLFGRSEDQGGTWTMPGTNAALLSVQTQADVNNAGDGQTHIGYNSGGKFSHYFRGKGQTNINTQEGMEINPGILKLVTGSNNVQFYANGTVSSIQRIKFDNGLVLTGARPDGIQLDAPTSVDGTKTILWAGGTRAGQNKSYVSIKAWGNSFNASGDRTRESVFEVADGQGYYFYAQRIAPAPGSTTGVIQFRVAGALLTGGGITSSGSIVTESSLVANNGLSVNGQAKFGGTADALRIWNAEYGAIFRRSEASLHIIPTPKDAGESGGISNLRPLSISLNNGMVQMRHSVTLGDDGAGGNMVTVDNDSKVMVMTTNSRISPNFRMQIGQSSYIDAECTNAVRPAGAGSFASQNNENVRAPFYMNIDRTDTSTYVPIVKQRYVQNNSCYSIGTLINGGNFRVHYHEGGDGGSTGAIIKDLGWEFNKNGDFYSPGKLGAGNVRIGTDGNITGGSLPNFANLNLTLDRKVNTRMVSYSGTGGWYKLATVTMPQSTSTVTFEIAGGNGYNVNTPHQCVTSKIVLRTSNNNPKGINAVVWSMDTDQGIKNVATVNTSGDVYDIYVNVGTYAQALAVSYYATPNATINQVFATDQPGATETAVELPETAIQGQVASVLNNLALTPNGVKRYEADSEIAINSQTGIRIRSNSDKTGSVATMLRNDGGSFYILFTDKNATDGAATVNGDWNSKRPFAINLTTGEVLMNNGIAVRSAALFYNSINVKDNGSINFDKSGANPRNMRIFHAGDGTRGNRIEIADETNYIAYFQKLPGGQNQVSFNSATLSGLTQCNQFGVNTTNALGGNSITFGDTDTGIKQNGDGLLDIYANNVQVFRFQNGDLYSYKNINAPNVYIRSDIRLKSNFKPIENALDKVEKLNGVIYDKAEYIGGDAIETEAGIVAQTLQDVLPEAVRETEDSKGNKILTVSSQAQIALLVEAVKTLSARVKELESKLM
ncbi:long tail fiber distal subunit [Escherichia phage PaulHMueller]|nr:long tail fiber distal subunit [Escherichia phage PaulHMueller]